MSSSTCEQLLYSGDIFYFVQGIKWDLYIRLVGFMNCLCSIVHVQILYSLAHAL